MLLFVLYAFSKMLVYNQEFLINLFVILYANNFDTAFLSDYTKFSSLF